MMWDFNVKFDEKGKDDGGKGQFSFHIEIVEGLLDSQNLPPGSAISHINLLKLILEECHKYRASSKYLIEAKMLLNQLHRIVPVVWSSDLMGVATPLIVSQRQSSSHETLD